MFRTALPRPHAAARGKDQLLCRMALLQLLPGAEAQANQPGGDLPPATAAMRYLEGYWQGTMSYSTEDGRTASRCVQQIVMRNGSLWQVYFETNDCSPTPLPRLVVCDHHQH